LEVTINENLAQKALQRTSKHNWEKSKLEVINSNPQCENASAARCTRHTTP